MTAVQAAGVSRNVSRSTVPHSDGPGPQPPRPRGQRPATMLTRHDDLIERLHTGPYDELPAPEVLAHLHADYLPAGVTDRRMPSGMSPAWCSWK